MTREQLEEIRNHGRMMGHREADQWRKERAESERAIELLLREAEPSKTP